MTSPLLPAIQRVESFNQMGTSGRTAGSPLIGIARTPINSPASGPNSITRIHSSDMPPPMYLAGSTSQMARSNNPGKPPQNLQPSPPQVQPPQRQPYDMSAYAFFTPLQPTESLLPQTRTPRKPAKKKYVPSDIQAYQGALRLLAEELCNSCDNHAQGTISITSFLSAMSRLGVREKALCMRIYCLFDPSGGVNGASVSTVLSGMHVLVLGSQKKRVLDQLFASLTKHPDRIYRRELAAMRVYHEEVHAETGLRREAIQFILSVFSRGGATSVDYLSRADFDAIVESEKWAPYFTLAFLPSLLAILETIHSENVVATRQRRKSSVSRLVKIVKGGALPS
eukprot:PhF_6_TR12957/c0_g1_i1/m.20457